MDKWIRMNSSRIMLGMLCKWRKGILKDHAHSTTTPSFITRLITRMVHVLISKYLLVLEMDSCN